ARVGSGIPIAPAPTDLADVLGQVIAELEDPRRPGRIRLTARGDVGGRWDGDRLAQVFSNLVANALRHGDPEADVAVRVDGDAPGEVVVVVRNGGEIPAELAPHLFEPLAGR